MKVFAVLFLVILMLVMGKAIPCNADNNLIQNGDFEQDKMGFTLYQKIEISGDKPHSGKECLLIPGPSGWAYSRTDDLDVEQNTYYKFSVWYRTQGGEPSVVDQVLLPEQKIIFALEIFDSNEKKITEGNRFLYPSKEWRKAEMYFYFAKNAKAYLKFALIIQEGDLYIDDMKLEVISKDVFNPPAEVFKDNLMENGDFEDKFPNGLRIGKAYQMDSPLPNVYLDKKAGFIEGKQSLKIVCKDNDAYSLTGNSFPVKAGGTYVYSMWMKSSIDMGITVWFATNPTPQGHWYKTTTAQVGTTWQKYQFEAEVPDKGNSKYSPGRIEAFLQWLNYLGGDRPAGTLWIDKVEVYDASAVK